MSVVTPDAPSDLGQLIRSLIHRQEAGGATLPDEGRLPGFEGATGWLNSEPLTPAGLRGRVVLVDFWTYTCINWLRTLPYVRAWAAKYRDLGLTVIGVHTPEFGFEHDRDNVIAAARDENVDYPIALDNDYAVWRAFANNFWPAIYIADAEGRLRYHHYGEREYAMTEMVIQQLLMDAGAEGIDGALIQVEPDGFEADADWQNLRSPETYLGYGRTTGFASPDDLRADEAHAYPEASRAPAQSVGADRELDDRAARRGGERGQRADRLPIPCPRRAPRHGPCHARDVRAHARDASMGRRPVHRTDWMSTSQAPGRWPTSASTS